MHGIIIGLNQKIHPGGGKLVYNFRNVEFQYL
jgi:hypothetical protein